jgi:Holliday junction resolvase RusA-like endonuclease
MTDPDVHFSVVGIPRPEGSTQYMGMRKGKPIIIHDNPHLNAWRTDVGRYARVAMHGRQLLTGRIAASFQFVVPAPIKMPIGRIGPTVPPDLDKYVRGIGDALTKIVYVDDAQITEYREPMLKRYPVDAREQTGVIIRVWALDPQQVGLFDAENT